MSKIQNNVRGDSGLTDSQVMISQRIFQQKSKEALDELEEYGIMETRRRRYEASAKAPKHKISLWQKIKSWIIK